VILRRGPIVHKKLKHKTAAHLSIFVAEVNAQGTHGTNNGDQRLNGVTVDDRLKLFIVLACETAFVNDSADTQYEHAISDSQHNAPVYLTFENVIAVNL